MKKKIIELRNEGKSYNYISSITGLSKATISYHCKRYGLNGRISIVGLNGHDIGEINEYYKTHTLNETKNHFNIGLWSLKKILENKRPILTDDERLKYNYQHVKNFRQKNKERAIEYKGGECVNCGYKKCSSALEFHHTNPSEKDFGPSKNMNIAWEKLKKELDKCILVCANCHREIHEELNWQISTQSDTLE
jgi:transposase